MHAAGSREPRSQPHETPSAPALQRSSGTDGLATSILRLQRCAGNRSTVEMIQRMYTGTPYVKYGKQNGSGQGTEMEAEIHAPATGSAPTVRPPWWPKGGTAGAAWFSTYMVQGHLLNENLGGPGNTMDNLTPLTKAANSMHLHKAEANLKKEIASGKHAYYHVTVKHGAPEFAKPVNAKTLGVADPIAEAEIDAYYAPHLAHHMEADVEIYEPGGKLNYGESWIVFNQKDFGSV